MRLVHVGSGARDRSRAPFLGLVVALALVAVPTSAFAHGRLKATSPGAGAHLGIIPRQLRLDFSEVPDLTFSQVSLIGPGGRPVALGPLTYAPDSHRAVVNAISGELPPGTYTVKWQLAGDDGHPVRGDFQFTVAPGAMQMDSSAHSMSPSAAAPGSAGGTMTMQHDPASMPEGTGFGAESPGYVVLRWLQFMALLLAIGSVAFWQLVLGSMRRSADAPPTLMRVASMRAARIGSIATGALLVTLVGRLIAQSYAMHGAADIWNVRASMDMIRKTAWGRGWLTQLAGTVAAGVGFAIAVRAESKRRLLGQTGHPPSGSLWGWPIATLGVLLLAFSASMSGHAAAVPAWTRVAIVANALHVIGASSWLGSLTLLLLAGIPAAMQLDTELRGREVARLVSAFSPVALGSAGLAVVTGVVAAWLHLGRVPALWGSRYGVTLLVKLAVLSVVAVTGFYNWRFVQPRLGTDEATARLRRSATIEVAVAVLVLLVTAVLVATPTALDMEM